MVKRNEINRFWWFEEKDVHNAIMGVVSAIYDDTAYRRMQNLNHLRLYGNTEMTGLGLATYTRVGASVNNRNRVTLNMVGSIVDTVVAKTGKNKPKATFLTQNGDFSAQEKAKRLDKFAFGAFYEARLYQEMARVLLDAAVFGTGFLKVYTDSKHKMCSERVIPNEILVDDEDGFYGAPRQMFQRKLVDREVLKALYPEHASKLNEVAIGDLDNDSAGNRNSDMVCVVEAWRLPTPDGPGRHVICVNTVTLLDEEWNKDAFPFIVMRWRSMLLGFWGSGIAAQIMGLQYEVNKLLMAIQQQMHLATPKVFIEAGSKISKVQINNEIWGIIEYAGTPPTFYVPKTVSGEIFAHLDRLYQRAFEDVGLSQLSASGIKPAGLESGRALREMYNIETERFVSFGQQYEEACLEAARWFVDLARDLYEDGVDTEVISQGDKDIEKIKWSDIDLKKTDYTMKLFPTNLLPSTPAGKFEAVQEMFATGLLSREMALSLFDFPDLEAATQLMNAPMDDARYLVMEILEHERYHAPEPFSNLALNIKVMTTAYLRAKINGAPERRLELMRQYIEESRMLLLKSQPALPAEGASDGMKQLTAMVGGQGNAVPPVAPN